MIDGRRWTAGPRQTVHLMDGFRRRTVKNIKMWTEMDGWTGGRKSVRRGLAQIAVILFWVHSHKIIYAQNFYFLFGIFFSFTERAKKYRFTIYDNNL